MRRSILIVFFILLLAACSSSTDEISQPSETGLALLTDTVPASAKPTPTASPLPPTATWTQSPPPTETAQPTSTPTQASALPDPALVEWQPVVSGMQRPVAVMSANDDIDRLFVVEQAGAIRIIQDGLPLPTPFLDIQTQVGSSGNEQGLLGLAFHPRYMENGYFYINYTDLNGDTVISRFQVSSTDLNLADPGSETRLLLISQPYRNHNGGVLAFGPDGYLYLGLGDGGSAGDPENNAQTLDSLLGKILRLDVDGGEPYLAPPQNVFSPGQRPEIWAYGLRNPWRFAFDRLTGDLYIGDVGQNQWEEINFLPADSPAGMNFGWKYLEGNHEYGANPPPAGLTFVYPILEYSHAQGCSVTGGVVYRGELLPDWNGVYIYGDYCSGLVWGAMRDQQGQWQQTLLFENVGLISSFGEDQAGEVYLVDLAGTIYKLAPKSK